MSGTSENGEVLTLNEAASFLRLPAEQVARLAADSALPGQKIDAEWRFLKAALADWLRYGHDYREYKRYGRHRPFEFVPIDVLGKLDLLSSRLGALEEKAARRGSKQAVMQHIGIFREDDDLKERLSDARERRQSGG